MNDAANLIGVEAARDIFKLVKQKRKCLTELHEQLAGKFAKQTIGKYVGQMEMVGILLGAWIQGDDGRWRRYYSPGNAEWARLFNDVIELEEKNKRV